MQRHIINLQTVQEENSSLYFTCNFAIHLGLLKIIFRGTWLAQLVGCATLDLRVAGSSPTLGVKIT